MSYKFLKSVKFIKWDQSFFIKFDNILGIVSVSEFDV